MIITYLENRRRPEGAPIIQRNDQGDVHDVGAKFKLNAGNAAAGGASVTVMGPSGFAEVESVKFICETPKQSGRERPGGFPNVAPHAKD
jgi:hypothetical protein